MVSQPEPNEMWVSTSTENKLFILAVLDEKAWIKDFETKEERIISLKEVQDDFVLLDADELKNFFQVELTSDGLVKIGKFTKLLEPLTKAKTSMLIAWLVKVLDDEVMVRNARKMLEVNEKQL